jgi:hypothetical protein
MALKGGSFIIGQGNPKDIFIREEFTEEQRSIAEMVKEFCIKEIQEPMMKRGRELEATKDREEIVALLEKSAELGFCGVSIAEEFGGMDLDFNTGLVFGEQIALGLSFATTIGAQTSIGSLPIVYYGTPEQQAKYLPGVASAQLKASYCLTEPTAGRCQQWQNGGSIEYCWHTLHHERPKDVDYQRRFCRHLHCVCQGGGRQKSDGIYCRKSVWWRYHRC